MLALMAFTVLAVFGTRPEAIKMCPLIVRLRSDPRFVVRVAVTAQHRELLDSVLALFGVVPDFDLNLMRPGQSLAHIAATALSGVAELIAQVRPAAVLVHGDTSTTLAAAQAAFYAHVPLVHVEAGLRSGDLHSPFPEEFNRRVVSLLAALHLAPTARNVDNLRREGVAATAIVQTGNTVIDALLDVTARPLQVADPILASLESVLASKRTIVMTCHRRENFGAPMRAIFSAVARLVEAHPDTALIFPVHPNPAVRELADELMRGRDRIHVVAPMDYQPFCHLMMRAHLLLTDSGGIQEEGPALGKPVMVLRTETERPEAVAAGTVVMAGVNEADIYRIGHQLLSDAEAYNAMARATNPYGDGTACERSAHAIAAFLQK